jgi:MarR family transcriptional regulator, organic hydroperoxide resistance regulator
MNSERNDPQESSLGAEELAAALGGALEFLRLLWAVDQQLRYTSKRMEATLGVTGLQRLVVRLVGRYPGIPAGRLAQLLHSHPSTLTGVLKRLVDQGQLVRKTDPLDARKARFFLTDAGHALNVPAANTVESAVRRAISRMPAARVSETREVLTALAEELGVDGAPLDAATHALLERESRSLPG